MFANQKIGVVIPAKNEQAAIGLVVTELLAVTDEAGRLVVDEVIVADNGSTDETAQVAKHAGATVISELTPGYGYACFAGVKALPVVDIIVFIDGDHAFYAKQIVSLLEPLRHQYDVCFGSRTLGRVERGALTPQQLWGNRLAVTLIAWLWGHQYTDLGPFRALKKELFNKLNMQEFTYGWTVEMQIKVLQLGYRVIEEPVDTRVRVGQSKVSGTLKGTVGAGVGILSCIAKLAIKQYWRAWTGLNGMRIWPT